MAADESGSILPLVIGYALLALALIVVCVDATSLYLAQKRLDALADAASLAAGDGFVLEAVDGAPQARLEPAAATAQAAAVVEACGDGLVLVGVDVDDGVSARVTVAGAWRPPVLSPLLPEGVTLTGTATSRTALS